MDTNGYMKQFHFKASGAGLVGVERECFTLDTMGNIRPLAPKILASIKNDGRFGYELSACQLEDRIGPCQLHQLRTAIERNNDSLSASEKQLDFLRFYTEVMGDDMPLDVYPDPTGRYQAITANMPRNILLAACQVAGTHIHIGMPDHEIALRVYNRAIRSLDDLVKAGDSSNGRRMEIYKTMAPDFVSQPYADWTAFHQFAKLKGFECDPRKCWHLIRISVHGTIEFRMFGSTPDVGKMVDWAIMCHELCRI